MTLQTDEQKQNEIYCFPTAAKCDNIINTFINISECIFVYNAALKAVSGPNENDNTLTHTNTHIYEYSSGKIEFRPSGKGKIIK